MTRNEIVAFLTCVLPAEGHYCAVIFDAPHPKPGIDKPRHRFVQTIEQLAEIILVNDQRGRTVYHACASYTKPKGRTQSNAFGARSLWLDIDVGESTPARPKYPDAEAAVVALFLFCDLCGIPRPLLVGSGGGVHCYWSLAETLSPGEWYVLAAGLKAACVRHGLLADPSRTSDIASILRTPGTHNRKNGGNALVQYDPAGSQQYPAAAFASLRTPGHGGSAPAFALSQRRPAEGHKPRGRIIDRIEAATSYPTVYSDFVADRCAQLDALRQSGSCEGWFLRIGVLAFCADGDDKAHEWSEHDYAEYDSRVVDDRLARSRTLTGATTCASLNDKTPGVCEHCPFWGKIKTPVMIPADPLDVRLERPARTPFNGAELNGHSFNGHNAAAFIPTVGGIELPKLSKPFRWDTRGKLVFESETNKGDQIDIIVSDFPVYLDTVQTGELDPTRFSYKLVRWLPQEGWRDVLIDAKLMFGSSGAAELADRGIVLHEHKHFLNYVRHAVTEFHEEEETHVRYDQFGWKNDNTAFLYGTMLYTAAGPVQAIGAKEVMARSQWIGPKKGGSLNAWTEAADSLFAADMEAYSAVILASFAAPLMRFQSADEGGAIVHLFTPGSGQGKTTALTAAWTIWGAKEGLSLTNEDTRVSKPIAIGTLANLPVIYDELRDKDPEYIKRMVIMFTEGRDRMRGQTDGTIRYTKANWQTMMLSAANQSLIDQLIGEGVDAPAFRVLELSSTLPAGIDKSKGDRLKRVLTENAGHAGDAYMRYLTQPEVIQWARKALEQWTDEIWRYTRLDSAHRFRVRAVGAMAVAAAIVNKLELLHFNTDRILEWLMQQLASNLNRGTVSAALGSESAIAAFGAFINAHLGETLIVPDRFKPRTPKMVPLRMPYNKLSVRYEIAPNRVFIDATTFRDWAITKGLSPRHVLDLLEKTGVIITARRLVTLSAGTNIPGAQVACIEVNASHPVMSGLVQSVAVLQPNPEECLPQADAAQSH